MGAPPRTRAFAPQPVPAPEEPRVEYGSCRHVVYLEISMIRYLLCVGFVLSLNAQDGRKIFETRCGVCHGVDGNGGEFAGSIVARIAALTDAQLSSVIRSGVPGRGMPPVEMSDAELPAVLAHLRTLRAPA